VFFSFARPTCSLCFLARSRSLRSLFTRFSSAAAWFRAISLPSLWDASFSCLRMSACSPPQSRTYNTIQSGLQ
jgi:hypothetical protein